MKHLLHLILLSLVVLNLYSCRKKNELPVYADFVEAAQQNPVQLPTERPPFTACVNDQTHNVEPLFDYRIAGMVVSCGFSENLAIHRKDDLNIMDAGIIWGDNLDPDIYQRIKFHNNGVWLHANAKDKGVWDQLNPQQLSNNHLLCTDPRLKKRIKAIKRGDVVLISGSLVSYSGRGSSTSRDDDGDGACETIWVDEFELLQDGTKPWHRLHAVSLYGIFAWIGIGIIRFFCSPTPGYEE